MRRFFWLGILAVPVLVQALTFQERIEDVKWEVEGDRFGSIGLGLARDAARRFG